MKIQVLGTGCPKCKKLMQAAIDAVRELGSDAEVIKVDKINDIMSYGVMVTPALAIDGSIKASGKIPSKEEIKKWISEKDAPAESMDRNKKDCGPCSCGNC